LTSWYYRHKADKLVLDQFRDFFKLAIKGIGCRKKIVPIAGTILKIERIDTTAVFYPISSRNGLANILMIFSLFDAQIAVWHM